MKPMARTVAFSPLPAAKGQTGGPKRAVHGGNVQTLGTGI